MPYTICTMYTVEEKNKGDQDMTIHYSAIQFFFWFAFGNVLNFASVYLLDNGMTNTQVGIFSASACAITVLIQPFLAAYADKERSVSLKMIITLFAIGEMILGALLLATDQQSVLLTGIIYSGAIIVMQILTPFINALGTESARQGKNLNFSIARGVGSVGYAVMAYSMGRVLDYFGSGIHPISIIIISAAMFISVAAYPFRKVRKSEDKKKKENGNPVVFLGKYRQFGIALLGCVLIYVSHIFINTFTYQIAVSKGGGSSEMGTAMAIAAGVEMITMFLFGYMLRVRDSRFWFRICGAFFSLKCFGTLMAWNIPTFYAVQVIQLLGWGLMAVASVYYVDSIMEDEDKVKGQTYMTMTYTVASIIGSMIGGTLLDVWGVNGMLIVGTAAGAAGTVIVMWATGKEK